MTFVAKETGNYSENHNIRNDLSACLCDQLGKLVCHKSKNTIFSRSHTRNMLHKTYILFIFRLLLLPGNVAKFAPSPPIETASVAAEKHCPAYLPHV